MFSSDTGFGLLLSAPVWPVISIIVLAGLLLAFWRAPLWLWTLLAAILIWGYGAGQAVWIVFGIIAVLFNVVPIRRNLISTPLMKILRSLGLLPSISQTEKIALKSGKNWFEGEYFAGRPNFHSILQENWPDLTGEEQKFLDLQAETVCGMVDDWDVHKRQDLPPEVWLYLKHEKFFGLVIPEKYGGKGFSAHALNRLIQKLGTRSTPLAVTAMVPNSLGPAELLVHYGTDKQKDYYLPRLADGLEIPAFALTEPEAGSDASSISSSGVVFKGDDGKLYLKLNWSKRYITLASVATLLGLAFQLEDPEEFLGKGKYPGITCALIPTNLPGVKNDERHNPLGVPFHNAPVTGKDVVVSVDQIIGGPDEAGNGWKMLMETLAGGRGIYLPALGLAGGKASSRLCSGYAQVREQFGLPIGRFEGIEEILARIGGKTYIMDAFNCFTCGAVDTGKRPAVITAIVKYMGSELSRQVILDAMDLLGGKGISLGPRNLLAHGYIGAPIGITVEGSNVLTRSLIIFGQGLISCHPWAYQLMDSIQQNDSKRFDKALWGHFGMMFSNTFRAFLLSLSRGSFTTAPVSGPTARYYKKLTWASASFSITADLALISMGAALKKKEKLSGRFADILSWLYMCTAVLKKFEAEGRKEEDLPFVHWAMQHGLSQIQVNFDAIYKNFRAPVIGPVIRGPVAFWSRMHPLSHAPGDHISAKVAELMQTPGGARDRLTQGIYLPDNEQEAVAILEKAFVLARDSLPVRDKLRKAVKQGKLPKKPVPVIIDDALAENIITREEAALLVETDKLRKEVIKVDSFPVEGFLDNVKNNTGL